jgi:hypothetical protein
MTNFVNFNITDVYDITIMYIMHELKFQYIINN